ncbi:MAG: hypothetical protein IPH80_33720 [Myxococcales bacterium]|nr:hypothetical protein [Myxococcales bacterium]
MLASRYSSGANGRIADFIIHNEVNHNIWFDVGCGQNASGGGITPCDKAAWIGATRTASTRHDRIKSHQSEAKVFVLRSGLRRQPDQPDHRLAADRRRGFIDGFAARWAPTVAGGLSPLPEGLVAAELRSEGSAPGDVRQRRRDRRAPDGQVPDQATRVGGPAHRAGINSGAGSSEAQQDAGLCKAHRNVLGTPNITSFILYRYKDFGALENGAAMGLVRADNTFKPSWSRWARMNKPGTYECGFEDLPYTILKRGYKGGDGHWASSRMLPSGFNAEGTGWKLHRERQPGTVMLFECARGAHNLLTRDQAAPAISPWAPSAGSTTSQVAGTVPLYACVSAGGLDHMVSTDPACEAYDPVGLLGYAAEQLTGSAARPPTPVNAHQPT